MSLLLCRCSLRSHFHKHLARTSFFSAHRSHHHFKTRRHGLTFTSLFVGSSAALYDLRNALIFRKLYSINATLSTSSSSESSATGSSTSPYLSVQIRCHRDYADMLSEALLCFGASSTSINEDEEDGREQNYEICISSIFAVCQDVQKSISHAAGSIGLSDTPSYEVTMGYHSDWIKKSQESFNPVEVTKGLWVVPEWRTPPDIQATNIILNPGLAFGTGDHPTTKLCLLLLHGLIKGGETFLDYGTGSGILAIAAIKFGAVLSVGFDIDPHAITAARHNASLNNIGSKVLQLCLLPDENTDFASDEVLTESVEGSNLCSNEVTCGTEKYDVVVANILLNPLLNLADQIVSYAKPGAVIALSGIISDQLPRITECYSEFLEGITVSNLDDWVCVSGTKKRNTGIN